MVHGRKGESRQEGLRDREDGQEKTQGTQLKQAPGIRSHQPARRTAISKNWTQGEQQRGEFPCLSLACYRSGFQCMMDREAGPLEGSNWRAFSHIHQFTHTHTHMHTHICRNRPEDAFMVQISQNRAPETDMKSFNWLRRPTTNKNLRL